MLTSTPEIGQAYRVARGKLIQRVLMKKTRCHVYYFHDREHDLVEIHSVWHCGREDPRERPAIGRRAVDVDR